MSTTTLLSDDDLSARIAEQVRTAVAAHTMGSERALQQAEHRVGPSEVGACRSYLARMIAQVDTDPSEDIKWSAFVGTALGDRLEMAVAADRGDIRTQVAITATYPNGLKISGSADAVLLGEGVWDFKSRDGLSLISREGPSFQERAQIQTYLLGAIQQGLVPPDGYAALVYVDRSGKQDTPTVFVYRQDPAVLDELDSRLRDVFYAVEHGLNEAPRDRPYDWCVKVCPFFTSCRGADEHQDPGRIEAPEHLAAITSYQQGAAMEKQGKALKDQAKEVLLGVSGLASELGVRLTWTEVPATMIDSYVRAGYVRPGLRKVKPPAC